ncbi:KAP family P-loop NTPase fold protein [Arcicella lustrica]|uniref:P-loop NTPase fold protein n=1 Tax=Arcicella lustrica TaxID=2984196 RepID=A0ABU5SME0_9BACT|nr:P-loop NTPase fold protein [Arcicella sp. DC25W]MEA5428436.1 P-loop NTPase fold protein [Arcicella sp. DC25W]
MIFPQLKKDISPKYLFEVISNRKIIFLSAVAVLPILFNKYFESILDEYIGKPIFQNLGSSYFSDIIFLVIAILLFFYYRYKYKNDHYFSSFDSSLVIVIGFWYFIYRCSGGWHYSRFYMLPFLSYSDIFLIVPIFHICFLFKRSINENTLKLTISFLFVYRNHFQPKAIHNTIVLTIRQLIRLKKKYSKDSKIGFQTDKPIEELSDEKLGRGNYAQKIAEQINDSFPKESFAIGITGKWGSGKTSFLHLIKKKLNENTIIVDFNAWHSHETKNLIADFFDLLKAELNDGSVSQHINLYVKQLTAVDDNIYFKTIDFLQKTIFGTQSTQEIFDRINASIKRLNKQIVIFIDDLDRLDNNEIIEIIKLVRISANFKNTVFVVAYDKGYVMNAIAEINQYEKELFLEKIFQAEFNLPTFEENRLRNILIKNLKENIDETHHNDIDEFFTDNYDLYIFEHCILTLRDVTRFTNSFCLNFQMLNENVVDSVNEKRHIVGSIKKVLFQDLLHIELLKFKCLSIYELIIDKKDTFLYSQYQNGKDLVSINFLWLKIDDFKIHLEHHHYYLGIDKSKIEQIVEIVNKIFSTPSKIGYKFDAKSGEKIDSENINSIRRPSNFDIYTSLGITDSMVSIIEFSKARQSSVVEFKNSLNKWLNKESIEELLIKFSVISFYDDEKDYTKIIEGLFHIGSNDLGLYIMRSEGFSTILGKLFNDNQLKIENNKYRELLLRIFEDNTYSLKFKSGLLYRINKRGYESTENFIIEKEKRLDLLFNYLEIYIKKQEKFTNDLWEIYENCTLEVGGKIKYNQCEERVNELIKSFALQKDIKGLFEKIIGIWTESGEYGFNSIRKCLFPDLENLFNFTNQLDDNLLKERLTIFFQELKKEDYFPISFNFDGLLTIKEKS